MNRFASLPSLAMAVAAAFVATTADLHAQDERFSFHGSINAAVGKSDGLGVFGLDKDGTSDYRAVSMLFGYKISEKDRVATQLLHRRIGTSPLSASEPAVGAVWAFYERSFDNGAKLKLGRNPLPRGVFNEVRFIGTLLPFYRVGSSVYGETLEYIDGAVLSQSFELTESWRVEGAAFAGGFDIRAVLPSSTGSNVIKLRAENSVGTQLWLHTPIDGVRLGAFVNNYMTTPRASLPETARGSRTTTTLYSLDAVREQGFMRGEYTAFNSKTASGARSNYNGWYVLGGVKPTEQLTLAVEYSAANNRVNLPSPIEPLNVPVTKDFGVAAAFALNANVVFKLEGHRQEGYGFDTPVPTVVPPTGPPFRASLAPAAKAFYGLASVAVAF